MRRSLNTWEAERSSYINTTLVPVLLTGVLVIYGATRHSVHLAIEHVTGVKVTTWFKSPQPDIHYENSISIPRSGGKALIANHQGDIILVIDGQTLVLQHLEIDGKKYSVPVGFSAADYVTDITDSPTDCSIETCIGKVHICENRKECLGAQIDEQAGNKKVKLAGIGYNFNTLEGKLLKLVGGCETPPLTGKCTLVFKAGEPGKRTEIALASLDN